MMPRFDKTGPQGKGPKTGRGRGDCNDEKSTQNKPDQKKGSWLDLLLSVVRLFNK